MVGRIRILCGSEPEGVSCDRLDGVVRGRKDERGGFRVAWDRADFPSPQRAARHDGRLRYPARSSCIPERPAPDLSRRDMR